MKLEELINKNYHQLNENDLHIWKYITDHRKECEKLSIEALAKKCNVSRSTILRFSKRLGLRGYAEFKVYLSLDNEFYSGTTSLEKAANTYTKYINKIKDADMREVVQLIYNARNVYVYGTGSIQNNVASELKRSFLMVYKLFFTIKSVDETDAYINIMDHQDIMIVISYSGENNSMLEFVKTLKSKGNKIISITVLKHNSLSNLADIALHVPIPSMDNPTGARYEGLVNYFILIDFLMIKYIDYLKEIGV